MNLDDEKARKIYTEIADKTFDYLMKMCNEKIYEDEKIDGLNSVILFEYVFMKFSLNFFTTYVKYLENSIDLSGNTDKEKKITMMVNEFKSKLHIDSFFKIVLSAREREKKMN